MGYSASVSHHESYLTIAGLFLAPAVHSPLYRPVRHHPGYAVCRQCFSPPNALSKIKVSIICPCFNPLDDRFASNTLLAIVSISNLRNKSMSKDDPAHGVLPPSDLQQS